MVVIGKIYSMDAPQIIFPRPIDPGVAQRHNVYQWHNALITATLYNKESEVNKLLHEAGNDATELVSTVRSSYGRGTILDVTYIENKPGIRAKLMPYMNDDSLMTLFVQTKEYYRTHSGFNKNSGWRCFPAEGLLREFHMKDSKKFPLTENEHQLLEDRINN